MLKCDKEHLTSQTDKSSTLTSICLCHIVLNFCKLLHVYVIHQYIKEIWPEQNSVVSLISTWKQNLYCSIIIFSYNMTQQNLTNVVSRFNFVVNCFTNYAVRTLKMRLQRQKKNFFRLACPKTLLSPLCVPHLMCTLALIKLRGERGTSTEITHQI